MGQHAWITVVSEEAPVLAGQRLADGDEAGAHVGEVRAHGEGGNDVAAGAERAGEDDGLVGDLADLVEEGEGVEGAAVAAGAGFERLLGVPPGGDVVRATPP